MSNIPKGYKQTEVGVIPVEWEVVSLSNLGDFVNGINKDKDDFGFGTPFVNLQDVFGKNEICAVPKGKVNASSNEIERYRLKKGDVLFIRSSVKPEGVGLTAVVTAQLEDIVFSGFIIRFRDDGSDRLYLTFKKYCFSTPLFRNALLAKSSVSANTNINQKSLETLSIPLPPLPEQKKIAEILTGVDDTIESTRQVIDQSKKVKQGLLQELLTKGIGHKKFKDTEIGRIPVEWEVGTVGDFFVLQRGFDITQKAVIEGTVPVISSSGISYFHKEAKAQGPGVITGRKGKLGLVFYVEENYWPHDTTLWVKDFKGHSPAFICWFLKGMELDKFDAATAVPTLNRNVVHMQPAAFPPLPEQKQIAAILSSVDDKISAQEKELAQLQKMKKGLMQDLLTGKVRVRV